ncbi:sortase [Bifidobacterium sp. DSM 109960]|uniref:Sortase n=1 Tax=Bifidobacterium erythrocebi TaxID=2675325 RepID=A0A7Y0ETE6_9BIFI|nr:class C sortase [Bifidobacterium sp. DSM 109960]NMM95668.1 sortase [Bifidobacterium sp. DSM 109960]
MPANALDSPSFEEILDVSEAKRRRNMLRIAFGFLTMLAVLLVGVGLVIGAYPLVMQWRSAETLADQSRQADATIHSWSYPQADNQLRDARAYNTRLATSGQHVLGQAIDPFLLANGAGAGGTNGTTMDSETSADNDSQTKEARDTTYHRLLDAGNGVMGSVEVPKVGIDLPIYHGTSDASLEAGAGHLYGTSLPVGGTNSHSVITGHRGLVESSMFTRLDEMRKGDFMYLKVMGTTLAYRVDRISVIAPDDSSLLKIQPKEDRLTLMTCTPYGINTQRLLISGTRVGMPDPAPKPEDVRDWKTWGAGVSTGMIAAGLPAMYVLQRSRHGTWQRMRHAVCNTSR